MNAIDLKYQIETLYDKAIDINVVSYKKHPVRVVQSIKSIIGINPEKPSDKLLSFCSDYLSKYTRSKNNQILKEESIPEVITLADLELSLKARDFKASRKNAYYLSKVSDCKHILEFLVEFSIKYDMQSFYCIWSIYKMMLFLEGKDIFQNIMFCIDLLINDINPVYINNSADNSLDLSKYQYDKRDIEIMWLYYSIINEDLVRYENISKYIYNNSIKKFKNSIISHQSNVLDDQRLLGREWIADYMQNIDFQLINVELVLILEACRSSLKASNGRCDDVIWDKLNTYLNEYR